MAAWSGVSPGEWHRRVVVVNVLPAFPGKRGRGGAFPVAQARARWAGLWRDLVGCRVVVLGGRLRRLVGLVASPPFRWEWRDGRLVAWMPHPSGLNHYWNHAEHVAQAEAFLREAIGEPPARPHRQAALEL